MNIKQLLKELNLDKKYESKVKRLVEQLEGWPGLITKNYYVEGIKVSIIKERFRINDNEFEKFRCAGIEKIKIQLKK